MLSITALFTLLPALPIQATTPPQAPSAQTAWGDFDADGLPDVLAIARDGRAALLLNAGDGSFRDHTTLSGLELGQGVRAAQWGDADKDGWPDLVVLGATSRLWRNLGNGTFEDATRASGLDLPVGAEEVAWLDYDRDGATDLLVSAPTGEVLFHNEGAGRFERVDLLRLLSEPPPVTVVEPAPPGPTERVSAPASSSGGAKASGLTGSASPGLPRGAAPARSFNCPPSIEDSSFPGNCLPASSIPTMGALLPIGPEFYVSPGGNVGINTTSPNARLAVDGRIRGTTDIIADGQLRSQVLNVPPLEVLSTQRVLNLNADLLDGVDSSVFTQLGQTIEGVEITNGTVTAADLADNSVSNAEIATDAVKAAELAPGAVGDVHVSVSASIAGSKIDPIFTAPVGIGTSTPNSAWALHAEDTIAGRSSDTSPGVYGQMNSSGTAVQGYTGAVNGKAGLFEIQNSLNNKTALTAKTTGIGRAALFSSTDPSSNATTVDVGTSGNGRGISSVAYGKGSAGHFEVSNASSNHGALTVVTNAGSGIYIDGSFTGSSSKRALNCWATGPQVQGIYVNASDRQGTYSVSFGSDGVVGGTNASTSAGVLSLGDFFATGSKNFSQPHPHDPSKEIVFTCLEGNESGTYFRGTTTLQGGRAVIDVPEEFRLTSAERDLTVQVTPVGAPAALYVAHQDLDRIDVRGDSDVTIHYQVNGVRRGFERHEAIRENRRWIPELRGVPFGSQYPEELRRLLVENGTLKADFTPDEGTAIARGWELRDPSERELERFRTSGPRPQAPGSAVPAPDQDEQQAEPAEEVLDEAGASASDALRAPALGQRIPVLPDDDR